MKGTVIAALLITSLLVACKGPAPASNEAAGETPPPAQSSVTEKAAMEETKVDQTASSSLQAVLKPGMAYADFREQVLAQGWAPVPDAQCKANVVGADHEKICSQDANMVACKVCDEMPELSACSGDGHCLVRFRHAGGEVLEATGYGMIEDWNVAGEDSRLQISKWSFSQDSGG